MNTTVNPKIFFSGNEKIILLSIKLKISKDIAPFIEPTMFWDKSTAEEKIKTIKDLEK